MIRWTSDSPRPVPWSLVVKKASKTGSSSGNPGPSSSTSISTSVAAAAGAQGQRAAPFLHGLDRVAGQVEQHLTEPLGVARCPGKRGVGLDLHRDARGLGLRRDQVDGPRQELRQVDRSRIERRRFGEGQELAHQPIEPVDLALDDPGDRGRLVSGLSSFQPTLEDGELKRRGVQGIANLVGQPGGQGPDRRQTFRPHGPQQHLLLVRHVDSDRVDQGGAAPRRGSRRGSTGPCARRRALSGRSCGRSSEPTSAAPSAPSISARE